MDNLEQNFEKIHEMLTIIISVCNLGNVILRVAVTQFTHTNIHIHTHTPFELAHKELL